MYKILIADDNPLVGESLQRVIPWEEMDCEKPFIVFDGDLARLEIEDKKPDIIISDIRMPGMDGLELLEWYRKLHPIAPFIIITGFDEFSYAKRALKSGADDLIIKPIDNKELCQTLVRALDKIRKNEKNSRKYLRYRERERNLESDLRIKLYRDILENVEKEIPSDFYDFNPLSEREFILFADKIPSWEVTKKLENLYALTCDHFLFNRTTLLLCHSLNQNRVVPLNDVPSLLERWDSESEFTCSPVFTSLKELPQQYRILQNKKVSEPDLTIGFSPINNPQVKGALEYLYKNYRVGLSLDQTAAALNLSGAHLTRLLKKETGYGFSELLSRLRVALAIDFLKKGDIKVAEAGDKVGLTNYAHFYQVFKKTTSFSPKDFPYGNREVLKKHRGILELFLS